MSEVNDNLDELSVEEIESRLDRLGMVVSYPDANNVEAPETEPEPEVVEESKEPEPVEEEKPQEAEPEPEPEPELTQDDIIKAELEALQAKAKHWESVAGRHAGELGFVKQQLLKLQQARQRVESDDSVDEGNAEMREPSPQRQPTRDSLSAWAVNQAVKEAAATFGAGRPDYQELQEDIGNYIKTSGYDPSQVLLMDDPIAASNEVTRLLEEAYLHAKAQRAELRKNELTKQRAEQTNKLAEAKRKAAVSASSSVPPPKPKPKTQDEMTLEEIEAEMLRQTGGRW